MIRSGLKIMFDHHDNSHSMFSPRLSSGITMISLTHVDLFVNPQE